MCGITGIFNLNEEAISSVTLHKMTDSIAHRGPDGEGFFIDNFIGLGHRRLAIIDLSPAAHQPMITKDNRYVLSYNGEIYNFKELRLELESLGYQFRSKTDSEVVLNSFAQWQEKALLKFNGMFAFAIWDKKKKELFLARDRYGIKPLYYTIQGSNFLFSSEIKAFLQHPKFQTAIDKEALLEYMTFQNFFTDKTLFKDTSILPAGSYLKINKNNKTTFKPQKYWDFHFQTTSLIKDTQEYQEELDRLFTQAVNRQLVSDVDVGSYLSGGMDSGSITAIAATQLPHMKTFTVGFDLTSASDAETSFDERKAAEYMSYLFKTEHYEVVLKPGDMERIIPQLAWHLEEPRVGQCYPNYYAAKLASKFVKVVLTGAGGDELFGGYPWRYYRAVSNNNFSHYIDKYYSFWQRLIPNTQIKNVFDPIWNDVKHIQTREIFENVFINHTNPPNSSEDYVNHSLYFEAKTFLHGLLVVEDKMSMAHSLETRVPFLDNDLVDFAQKLPVSLKLGKLDEVGKISDNAKMTKYFNKTKDGKLLLRTSMEKYLPASITNAIKQGFSAPDASWFKKQSLGYVKEVLFNDKAKIYNFMHKKTIKNLINEHLDGKQNRRLLIWSLLNLENCLNIFLGL